MASRPLVRRKPRDSLPADDPQLCRLNTMTSSRSKLLPDIGFMTVVESTEHGFFGGYLVLNHTGRPLEFHCTAPVRPNRAQEILYGPTLKPYLIGEQIGQTLWSQTKNPPSVICTDMPEILHVRQFSKCPIALLKTNSTAAAAEPPSSVSSSSRLDPPHPDTNAPMGISLCTFHTGDYTLSVAESYREDEAVVQEQYRLLGDGFDLFEPFDRIHHAIQEAQQQ